MDSGNCPDLGVCQICQVTLDIILLSISCFPRFWLPVLGTGGLILTGAVILVICFSAYAIPILSPKSWEELPISSTFSLGVLAIILAGGAMFITPSNSNAHIANLIMGAGVLTFVRLWERLKYQGKASCGDLTLVWLIFTLAFLTKIGLLIFFILPLAASVQYDRHGVPRKTIFLAALPAIGIGLLWALRNIGLSGCLIYPAAITCFDILPWAIGTERVQDLSDIMSTFAKSRRGIGFIEKIKEWDWYSFWWNHELRGREVVRIAIIGALCCAIAFVGRIFHHVYLKYWSPPTSLSSSKSFENSSAWMILGFVVFIAILNAVFVFFTAPIPRYTYVSFWIVFGSICALLIIPMVTTSHRRLVPWLVLGLAFVGLFGTVIPALSSFDKTVRENFVSLNSEMRMLEPLVEKRRIGEVDIYFPSEERCPADGTRCWRNIQCWLTPRPCGFEIGLTVGLKHRRWLIWDGFEPIR